MAAQRIGILTGGGDVPGLNAAIKAVYQAATDRGWVRPGTASGDVLGIRRGWSGTIFMGDAEGAADAVLPLTGEVVRTIDRYGGTFLHSSRTRPDRVRPGDLPPALKAATESLRRVPGPDDLYDLTDRVIGNLKAAGLTCLVVIGGDDTLGYGYTLHERGFPVVGIPKTMDNDVRGTEYAIGFKTALTRADQFINRQRTHLGSHEMVGVFRIFGRNAGFTALGAGMSISDIRCLIPEQRFDLEALARLVRDDHARNPQHYALVLCSEGAIWEGGALEDVGAADAYGHRKKENVGEALARRLGTSTGLPTRFQDITYDLRSGDPDPFDKIIATAFGTLAVDLIASGTTGRMVCIQDGRYTHAPLPAAALGARTVDVAAYYDIERFRPRFSGLFDRSILF